MADSWYNMLQGAGSRQEAAAVTPVAPQHAAPADETPVSDSSDALLRRLVATNGEILQRLEQQVSALEAERREREALSAKIAHLTAAIADLRGAPLPAQPIAQMVRDGVADEIRPLLVAVVELLELGLGLGPAPESAPKGANGELSLMHGLELPTILTRPLEDLLEPRNRAGPRSGPVKSAREGEEKPRSSRRLFRRRQPAQRDADGDQASRRTRQSPWRPIKS